jgi:hypothetical protein
MCKQKLWKAMLEKYRTSGDLHERGLGDAEKHDVIDRLDVLVSLCDKEHVKISLN